MAWKPRPKHHLLPKSAKTLARVIENEAVRKPLTAAVDVLTQDYPPINEIETACIKLSMLYEKHCTQTLTGMSIEGWNVWMTLKKLDLREREPDAVEAVHKYLQPFFLHQTELFLAWSENNPNPSLDDLEKCEPYQILSRCVHPGRKTVGDDSAAFLGQNTLG